MKSYYSYKGFSFCSLRCYHQALEDVKEFLEKPTSVHLAGTMIFALELGIFEFIPENKGQSVVNLTGDVIPKVLKSGRKFSGYPFGDYWVDVGRLSDYEEAHTRQHFK